MSLLSYLAARMKEASSYAGFAAMALSMAHISVAPTVLSAGLGAIAAIGGFIAVVVPGGKAA